jgi:signal transduction histidine kinase
MPRFSLQGRFIFLLAAILIATVTVTVWLALKWASWPLVLPVVVAIALLAVIAAVKTFFRPVNETLQALRSGVASFKDHDYSVTISANRDDELGELVAVYNDLATTLREERFSLFQRELLLDTVIQSSAVAVVIVNHRGVVVYSNRESTELLGRNGAIEGETMTDLCEDRSAVLADAVRSRKDGLFSLAGEGESDVYHLTCRQFNLNSC